MPLERASVAYLLEVLRQELIFECDHSTVTNIMAEQTRRIRRLAAELPAAKPDRVREIARELGAL